MLANQILLFLELVLMLLIGFIYGWIARDMRAVEEQINNIIKEQGRRLK